MLKVVSKSTYSHLLQVRLNTVQEDPFPNLVIPRERSIQTSINYKAKTHSILFNKALNSSNYNLKSNRQKFEL